MKKEEFELKKKLIELQKKANLENHKLKMIELEYLRESNRLYHEREMTRNRIKTAEIRKQQERKDYFDQQRRKNY